MLQAKQWKMTRRTESNEEMLCNSYNTCANRWSDIITQRKIMFLQKLCTTSHSLLSRKILEYRLQLYFVRNHSGQSRFIPDIYCVLRKYNLLEFINTYHAICYIYQCAWNCLCNGCLTYTIILIGVNMSV